MAQLIGIAGLQYPNNAVIDFSPVNSAIEGYRQASDRALQWPLQRNALMAQTEHTAQQTEMLRAQAEALRTRQALQQNISRMFGGGTVPGGAAGEDAQRAEAPQVAASSVPSLSWAFGDMRNNAGLNLTPANALMAPPPAPPMTRSYGKGSVQTIVPELQPAAATPPPAATQAPALAPPPGISLSRQAPQPAPLPPSSVSAAPSPAVPAPAPAAAAPSTNGPSVLGMSLDRARNLAVMLDAAGMRNEFLEAEIGRASEGPRAAEQARGKALGEAQASLPQALQSGGSMITNIDAIINDPNRTSITGWQQWGPFGYLPYSPSGRDTLGRVQQVQGQAFLQAYQSLKGAGQISEQEGAKAQAALTRLADLGQSDAGYQQALFDARREVWDLINLARRRAGQAEIPYQPHPSEGRTQAQGQTPPAPEIGAIDGGYRFKGGNPADPASWERAQ